MGIRNTVGLAISLAQVSFQIAFDCESNFSPFEHLDIIDWKQVMITFGSSLKNNERKLSSRVLFFISIDVNELWYPIYNMNSKFNGHNFSRQRGSNLS